MVAIRAWPPVAAEKRRILGREMFLSDWGSEGSSGGE